MTANSVVFDRAADYYDATRGFPPGEIPAVVDLFLSTGALTPAARVLEVGTGTGRIALPLAPHVSHYVGLDLSRPMLERLATKRAGEPVAAVLGDATALPLATHSVDVVVAVHVFHLIPAWQTALQEVARVLRPGGVLLSGGSDHPAHPLPDLDLLQIWREASGQVQEPNVGVPRDQYGTFLIDEGWQRLGERRTHSYPLTRTSRELLERIENRVWSSMWLVSDEAHARGLAAVRAVIAANALDLDAPVSLPAGFSLEVYAPPST